MRCEPLHRDFVAAIATIAVSAVVHSPQRRGYRTKFAEVAVCLEHAQVRKRHSSRFVRFVPHAVEVDQLRERAASLRGHFGFQRALTRKQALPQLLHSVVIGRYAQDILLQHVDRRWRHAITPGRALCPRARSGKLIQIKTRQPRMVSRHTRDDSRTKAVVSGMPETDTLAKAGRRPPVSCRGPSCPAGLRKLRQRRDELALNQESHSKNASLCPH